MRKILLAVLGVMLSQSILSQPVHARTLEGIEIPEAVSAKDGTELKLQGAAVRSFYHVIDGYIGALYLENKSTDVASILADNGYKRMTFTVLLSKMSARKIGNAFYEAIQINTSPEEQKELEKEIQQFVTMIDGTVTKGEGGSFEYIPGQGARVTVAGEVKGVIPGKKAFNVILKVWIGDTPPTQNFKDGVLGRKTT
ncbi:chalcone isomerase family protein [Endozoicomonas sp. OPT23]|uniref:chalcone isomerase family protein n=1 Tax=Endozoicomonas sp. OPT23 TaxID=2072845 RepID=UPI0018914747|nr:chalcone isomerase family protein [Endozoicomonas sp. OPT23]